MHWHNNLKARSRALIAVLAVVVTATGLLVERSLASDHQDTADVELNPAMDMTDVYAFPGSAPDGSRWCSNSWAFLTPAEAQTSVRFDDEPALSVQGGQHRRREGGPGHPGDLPRHGRRIRPSKCAVRWHRRSWARCEHGRRRLAHRHAARWDRCSAARRGMQVFAGPRQDPFFIDLEQFFRIVPDRKPVDRPALAAPRHRHGDQLPRAGQRSRHLVEAGLQRAVDRDRAARVAARRRSQRQDRHLGHDQPLMTLTPHTS